MDLHQLEAFVEAVNLRSFTKASEKLFITQPLITRYIKNLETEYGVQLIKRSSKSFSITPAGELLYKEAVKLIAQANNLSMSLGNYKNGAIGEVVISIPGPILETFFAPLLVSFREVNTGITIDVIEEGSRNAIKSILSDDVDIGLVMLPVIDSEKLDVMPLFLSSVEALMKKDHPLAKKSSIKIGDLKGYDIITYGESATLYHKFNQLCANENFTPKIIYKSLMSVFGSELISYCMCIGIYPLPVIKKHIRDNIISVPLEPEMPWEMALITKKGKKQSCATNKLIEYIKDYFDVIGNKKRI